MSISLSEGRRVAVVGASGLLGAPVLSALCCPEFRSTFSEIVLLKRATIVDLAETSKHSDDVKVRYYTKENLVSILSDIDVLINLIGPKGHKIKDMFLRAIPGSGIKLYIPSEFGVDHDVHDFPHAEWDQKKHHAKLAKRVLTETRMCRLFVGLFLEESIGPWFGMDGGKLRYHAIGSATIPVSFSSLGDVGKAVASLSGLPYDQVPAIMHIAGDTLSINDIAHTMEQAGSEKIAIDDIELGPFKATTLASESADPSQYLRFLMGEGKINHTAAGLGNDNELINPGERLWKWRTMKDYAQKQKGRPWNGIKWSES